MSDTMKETVFDYRSAFKYTKVLSDEQLFCGNSDESEDDLNGKQKDYPLINRLVHKIIVLIFYSIFIITFPISAFFCLKRIHSLQRCLVYRLGIRLPLKGPGLIIRFPIIDCIEIIDLSDFEFVLVDKTQQLMTSDGSIVEFQSFNCCLNVTNVIRSSTQLKDAKFNVQQFSRLSFVNMIGSTHIEDLENKIDIIMRQFEQNSNLYLNNWGYNCKFKEWPKFVVINRADPFNPVVYKLKSMFSGDEPQGPNGLIACLSKLQKDSIGKDLKYISDLDDNQIVESLQSMAGKYGSYVFHDINIAIQVMNSIDYFVYSHSTGKVTKTTEKPNKVHINIIADSREELKKFCCNQDMNSVRITTNLM